MDFLVEKLLKLIQTNDELKYHKSIANKIIKEKIHNKKIAEIFEFFTELAITDQPLEMVCNFETRKEFTEVAKIFNNILGMSCKEIGLCGKYIIARISFDPECCMKNEVINLTVSSDNSYYNTTQRKNGFVYINRK